MLIKTNYIFEIKMFTLWIIINLGFVKILLIE